MKTTIQILTVALLLPVCAHAGEAGETIITPDRTQAPLRHFYIDDNGNAWPVRATVIPKTSSVHSSANRAQATPKTRSRVAIQSTKDSVRPAGATDLSAAQPVVPPVLHFANRPAVAADEVETSVIEDRPVTLESRLSERAIY